MKTDIYVEFDNNKINSKGLVDEVKEIWKAEDKLVKDIQKLEIYLKPQEGMCYYVINEDITGKLPLSNL